MAISGATEEDLRAERMGASQPLGVARPCQTYAGERARHRAITPDGQDFIITTATDVRAGSGFLTGAYPVSRGYLMMMRQPLVETRCAKIEDALEVHHQLTRDLANDGARYARAQAQATMRARKRAQASAPRATQVMAGFDGETLAASAPLSHSIEAFAGLN